jgi:hypothetical protein
VLEGCDLRSTRAYDVWSFAGQLAIKDDGEQFSCDISPNGKARKIFTTRVPLLGVISAITPFNHPLNMVSHKLAPAIATNNRVVLKPTELTPLTALALADVLYEAGLPPEMLSVVTGNPRTMGDAMITDPAADLITFTGSVRVGKYIAEKAGYRRIVLELGGNDPLIVMEDADLDKAAELAVQGATKNSGQRCTAVKRILCVESVADEFAKRVVEKAKKLKCGNPADTEVDVGTVINERAAKLFEARVKDAEKQGAEVLYGHDRARARSSTRPWWTRCPTWRTGARGDLRAGHPDHPRAGQHGRDHPHLEFHGLWPLFRRVHEPHRLHPALHRGTRCRHGQCLGGAGLSHRDEPVRRHQGFRPRLQGRRVGGDEELHQCPHLVDALECVRSQRRVRSLNNRAQMPFRLVTELSLRCNTRRSPRGRERPSRGQGEWMKQGWLAGVAMGLVLAMGWSSAADAQGRTRVTVYTALENDQLQPFKQAIEADVPGCGNLLGA